MEEQPSEDKLFVAEKSKSNRAKCKKCKEVLDQGTLRIAKVVSNPFGDGKMMAWHHPQCLVTVFSKQRATTAKITCVDDIGNWNGLSMEHQKEILTTFPDIPKEKLRTHDDDEPDKKANKKKPKTKPVPAVQPLPPEYYFKDFRKLCMSLSQENSHLQKMAIFKEFINTILSKEQSNETRATSIFIWCKMLLPNSEKRVYNLHSKQIIKLYSQLFKQNVNLMLEDLEKGDVAETIRIFFEKSNNVDVKPSSKSTLTLRKVDSFLDKLSIETTEHAQTALFRSIATLCTGNDLKMIIRLVMHDLRINCGPKYILGALHSDAYEAYQTSHDLKTVVYNACSSESSKVANNSNGKMSIKLSLLTPILPMLAEPCKNLDDFFKKCPSGIYSEIKYDGERVQLHKSEKEFKFFSRSLKPVLGHKVEIFKQYIPKAFQHGKEIILDCEVLMYDQKTDKPLPFGTLGIHKKSKFEDANPCLFIFDCMYYNGISLLDRSIVERRQILMQNMTPIKGHIMFSEVKELHNTKELKLMVEHVLKQGLEGLVLKDLTGIYEPGKRHWQKIKKDYLFDGSMADSADLVVLGAWFGTGNKGGMMSIFLMGCYNEAKKNWCTVTKVHGGHDDKTLERLQGELKMIKISKSPEKVPEWLKCTKTMIPDFVAEDPKKMPVWEISGAEFSQAEVHTANGISIRFPRVTKIRNDKDWKTATSLTELKNLYEASKDTQNLNIFSHVSSDDNDAQASPEKIKKLKRTLTTDAAASLNTESPAKKSKFSEGRQQKLYEASKDTQHLNLFSKLSSGDNDAQSSSEKIKKLKRTLTTDAAASLNTESPAKKSKFSEARRQRLPDLFLGISVVVPDSKYKNTFLRYFIAYGGKPLSESDGSPTHLIVNPKQSSEKPSEEEEKDEKKNSSSAAVAVCAQWFWDSIRKGVLLPVKNYQK